ncbi:MAG: riboflavin biosynthesis protein RibD, partial [Alphaproteobacteria bacterium]|nr:riboflavin biosynthesis protein RibD [Alphaproteobacteria bacterium]
ARGTTRVFSEGGPRVAAQLIHAGLADETIIFSAAKPLGRQGTKALDAQARAILSDPARYCLETDTHAGTDRMRIWNRVV